MISNPTEEMIAAGEAVLDRALTDSELPVSWYVLAAARDVYAAMCGCAPALTVEQAFEALKAAGAAEVEAAAHTAAECVLRVSETQWQPIASAPKDGRAVDLWVESALGHAYRLTDAYWRNNGLRGAWLDAGLVSGWWAPNCSYGEPGYAGLNDGPVTLRDGRTDWDRATHWMPLPEPPTAEA